MTNRLAATAAIFLATTTLAAAQSDARAPFTVALWGDMPYARANDGPKIPNLVASINTSDVAFTLYDGDIKDGSSKCTDAIYTDAIKMFDSLDKPTVYIPGDNEWTDCHRTNNGGYNAVERLGKLRSVLTTKADSFGKATMPLERAAAPYVENVRLSHNGVWFVGLNIPGSNNGKVTAGKCVGEKSARTEADCAAANEEFEARDKANIAFLSDTFARAKADDAAGVMVVIQGDPGFDVPETEDANERADGTHDGFDAFLEALMTEATAFGKEVVLVHGDTHYFKIDKPLRDYSNMMANITRVETFGSPNIHWVKAKIDPSATRVFDFQPIIVPANASNATN